MIPEVYELLPLIEHDLCVNAPDLGQASHAYAGCCLYRFEFDFYLFPLDLARYGVSPERGHFHLGLCYFLSPNELFDS